MESDVFGRILWSRIRSQQPFGQRSGSAASRIWFVLVAGVSLCRSAHVLCRDLAKVVCLPRGVCIWSLGTVPNFRAQSTRDSFPGQSSSSMVLLPLRGGCAMFTLIMLPSIIYETESSAMGDKTSPLCLLCCRLVILSIGVEVVMLRPGRCGLPQDGRPGEEVASCSESDSVV